MNSTYLDALRDHGQSLITHIALFGNGVELSSGGYARQAVTWTDEAGSISRPDGDLAFTTDTGDVVDEWRGFSAVTGGTDYGGEALTEVTFVNPGTYTLLAASTAIDHNAG